MAEPTHQPEQAEPGSAEPDAFERIRPIWPRLESTAGPEPRWRDVPEQLQHSPREYSPY